MTQCERILQLLEEKESVTNIELNSVCFRYGARLLDLRNQGHDIKSKHIKDSLWEFRLIKEPTQLTLV